MSGYTRVANDVLFDTRLSLGARVTYGGLHHLAWVAGRRKEKDGVRLPPLDEIALKVGCSRTALKGYVTELRQSGLVVTIRQGHQGMRYFLFDTPTDGTKAAQKERLNRAESVLFKGRNTPSPRAGEEGGPKDKDKDPPNPPAVVDLTDPPRSTLVEGRNLPLDALCAVTGIVDGSPRIAQAAVALNGRGTTRGIRALYWQECRAFADREDAQGGLARLQADPEAFEQLLAQRIRRKAALILDRQTWRTSLAPSHVRDLWLDIEHEPAAARTGLTGDQIREGIA